MPCDPGHAYESSADGFYRAHLVEYNSSARGGRYLFSSGAEVAKEPPLRGGLHRPERACQHRVPYAYTPGTFGRSTPEEYRMEPRRPPNKPILTKPLTVPDQVDHQVEGSAETLTKTTIAMKTSAPIRQWLWSAVVGTALLLLLTGCTGPGAGPPPIPVIRIGDTRIAEFNNGATKAAFKVELKPASDQVVTVDYATADITAVAGQDYTETKGTLTFLSGETMKTINVAITDDSFVEPYETLSITLSSPSNATLEDGNAVGTVTNDDTKIYYVDDGWHRAAPSTILRANLDGTDVEPLVTSDLERDNVRGIALDIAGGSDKVYWTVYWPDGEEKIKRANLDGSDVETVLIPSCNPQGIALDAAGGKMYWTSCGIWRANLDGSDAEHLVPPSEISRPIGIALNLAGGKMYWTDRGDRVGDDAPRRGNIKRANLDGSDVDVLVDVTYQPQAIAVDPASGKIYWSSESDLGPIVHRANLNGSDIENIVTLRRTVLGVALDTELGQMYLTNYGGEKVLRANLDGSRVEEIVAEPGSYPAGIALALR